MRACRRKLALRQTRTKRYGPKWAAVRYTEVRAVIDELRAEKRRIATVVGEQYDVLEEQEEPDYAEH